MNKISEFKDRIWFPKYCYVPSDQHLTSNGLIGLGEAG